MNQRDENQSAKRIKSVQRAFDIIDIMQDTGSMHIADLAEEMAIPRSTAHVYLKTLESTGYVSQDRTGYRLSLQFLQSGIIVREWEEIYRVAREEVNRLAENTKEVANLGVEQDGLRVILYQSEGSEAVYDNALIGEHANLHWTALGKAILAHKPDGYIGRMVESQGLPPKTENTIVDVEALMAEAESIRSNGYALEDEERYLGIRSIAVPLIVESDIIGALSVSGPKERLSDQRITEELVPELLDARNVVELRFTYD